MNYFQDFREVRGDGKIITSGMSISQINALGEISRVVEVSWRDCIRDKPVSLKSKFGVNACVVQGAKLLAVLIYETENRCTLSIVDSAGAVTAIVSNAQKIDGQARRGFFIGLAAAHTPRDGVFGARFNTDDWSAAQYWGRHNTSNVEC